MWDFLATHPLTSISAKTNGGFSMNEFVPSCLIDPKHILDHGCHVLNNSDKYAIWECFWAFQARAVAIVQHLQGFWTMEKLKADLKKVQDSLDSSLLANITLAGENSNLKVVLFPLS